MLMALGMFVFSLPTLAYQEMQRQSNWRHPSNSRVGSRSAHQYVGPGDDTVTLSGVLVPELLGRASTLEELRAMADTGKAWVLVSGAGEIFGAFVIENTGADAAQTATATPNAARYGVGPAGSSPVK